MEKKRNYFLTQTEIDGFDPYVGDWKAQAIALYKSHVLIFKRRLDMYMWQCMYIKKINRTQIKNSNA